MTESYYAIRIGKRPKHMPYLMVGPDNNTPWLFATRSEALANKGIGCRKVVKVTIKFKP